MHTHTHLRPLSIVFKFPRDGYVGGVRRDCQCVRHFEAVAHRFVRMSICFSLRDEALVGVLSFSGFFLSFFLVFLFFVFKMLLNVRILNTV